MLYELLAECEHGCENRGMLRYYARLCLNNPLMTRAEERLKN